MMRYAERSTPSGSGKGSPSTWRRDRQAGAADLFSQRVEAVEAGVRLELDLFAFAAHGGQEAAHLGQCRASRLLDAFQRVTILGERIRKLVPDGADLEHHHADGVRDDVVEFAGDPCTLLGRRDPRRRLPVALGLGRACLCRFGFPGPLAHRKAGQPADPEHEREKDLLGGGVVGHVVVHDCGAADDDGQAGPRLHGVRQVAEQERGSQPRIRCWPARRPGGRRRRKGSGDQPVRRRRGERVAAGERRASTPSRRAPGRRPIVVAGASFAFRGDDLDHRLDRQDRAISPSNACFRATSPIRLMR